MIGFWGQNPPLNRLSTITPGAYRVFEYQIPVRNDDTGEIRIVEISSSYEVDAQVEAVQQLFKQDGWRKCTALHAEVQVTAR